jgi:D-sedoheptulose 7-phosphate isomerase
LSDFSKTLQESIAVVASPEELEPTLLRVAARCAKCLNSGGKLLICGNGGSAAEAMHLVGELVGRYKIERPPLAALSLGTDPALTTCVGNDYSYDDIFSRQLRALARSGDVLVVFSTSGHSPSVIAVLKVACAMAARLLRFLAKTVDPHFHSLGVCRE